MSAYGFVTIAEAERIAGAWSATRDASSLVDNGQPATDGDAPEYDADPVADNLGTCAGMVEQDAETISAQVGIARSEADAATATATAKQAILAALETRLARRLATLDAIRAAQRAMSGDAGTPGTVNGSGSPAALYGRDGSG